MVIINAVNLEQLWHKLCIGWWSNKFVKHCICTIILYVVFLEMQMCRLVQWVHRREGCGMCVITASRNKLIICLDLLCVDDTKHHLFKSLDKLVAIIIPGCTETLNIYSSPSTWGTTHCKNVTYLNRALLCHFFVLNLSILIHILVKDKCCKLARRGGTKVLLSMLVFIFPNKLTALNLITSLPPFALYCHCSMWVGLFNLYWSIKILVLQQATSIISRLTFYLRKLYENSKTAQDDFSKY